MNLLPEDVQDVLKLLETLPFDEFEVETAQLRVRLRRAGADGWTQESQVLSSPNVEEARAEDAAVEEPAPDPREAGGVREGLISVRAPLPGTFYRAPKPGADPYVDVGSRVEEESVVGLIETMKLFNSVHANVRGTVVELVVNDAEFAQKDASLMLIRPDAD